MKSRAAQWTLAMSFLFSTGLPAEEVAGPKPKSRVRVAAVQMKLRAFEGEKEYASTIDRWVEQANGRGADLVVFPEDVGLPLMLMTDGAERPSPSVSPRLPIPGTSTSPAALLIGDLIARNIKEVREIAQEYRVSLLEAMSICQASRTERVYHDTFAASARRHKIIVAAGTCPVVRDDGARPRVYNAAYLFDETGRWMATSLKVNPIALERSLVSISPARGHIPPVVATRVGSLGVAICADCFFPDLIRAMGRSRRLDILIDPRANPTPWSYGESEASRTVGLWRRAQENACYAVECFAVGGIAGVDFEGRTQIVAPAALTRDGQGVLAVARNPRREELVVADLDMAALERFRNADSGRIGASEGPASTQSAGGGDRGQLLPVATDGSFPSSDMGERVAASSRDHPGNIFALGDEIRISISLKPGQAATRWRLYDDRLTLLGEGRLAGTNRRATATAILGKRGIGWYRIEFVDAAERSVDSTTAAVLASRCGLVPSDSPVCVDAAVSWYPQQSPMDRERLVRLASAASVSWIRDRLRWRELEPAAGTFAGRTVYDDLARVQAGAGMSLLQTFHGTPRWAAQDGKWTHRFPDDLRHVYRFCKAMSERFTGQVRAWEPWNEANAANFGGHPIDEMCSFQKAAYLGFKAGDPNVTVCWNPIGGINTASMAEGILKNETWPYYETYNIHSYDWPHDYAKLWAPAREAACGRPIWVTECDRGMKAETGSPMGDYSHPYAIRKAEFMAHSYVSSLYSGATRHFHFILGHYMEQDNTIQFGLLRKDLTPRPSYVALAAIGRILAGGRCLGRWTFTDNPDAHIYAFRARPDGVYRDVLVVWVEEPVDWPQRGRAKADWSLPEGMKVEGVFDYMGRSLGKASPKQLGSAAVFIVMPSGECDRLPLVSVRRSDYRVGLPSPVVLQLQTSANAIAIRKEGWTEVHERVINLGGDMELRLWAYNFGPTAVRGIVGIDEMPDGWKLTPDRWDVSVDSLGRQELIARVLSSQNGQSGRATAWIRARGEFGDAGRPVLAFRFANRQAAK